MLPAPMGPTRQGFRAATKRLSAMSAERTVTFPIANKMFGLDRLAKRLNALVTDGQIRDWHPGCWIDWGHTAIPITFDPDMPAPAPSNQYKNDGSTPRFASY